MGTGHFSGIGVAAQRATDSLDFVCDQRHANAGAANENALVTLTLLDGFTKLVSKIGVMAGSGIVGTEIDVTDEEEFNVRIKSFKFRPMSVEEAILQMNLLQHSFYVFINDKTEEVNVVYVKEDGDYGCIVPE